MGGVGVGIERAVLDVSTVASRIECPRVTYEAPMVLHLNFLVACLSDVPFILA